MTEHKKIIPREDGTTELRLDKELAVHYRGSRVEGSTRDGRVNIVLGGGGVSNQEPDSLKLVEPASIGKACEDLVNGVCISVE